MEEQYQPPVDLAEEPEPTPEMAEVGAEPEVDVNAEPAEEDAESQLAARLKALEQRVGTEEDVRKVKSQRDQLRNDLEQIRPLVEQLQAQVVALTQARAQNEDAAFEASWSQYIQAQPPERRELARQQYEAMKLKREADLRAAAVAAREQQLAAVANTAAEKLTIESIQNLYREQARAVGVDPDKLDMSSAGRLQESFRAEYEKVQRLKQNPPPRPAHAPQRAGAPAPAKDIMSWFEDAVARNDFKKINAAFQATENQQGWTVDDIVRR